MIMFAKLVFVYLTLVATTFANVLPPKNFQECQRNYDEKIGELVATSGMSAATTVWRILFDDFDLNGDKRINACELVLKLHEEDLFAPGDIKTFFTQAQAWIDSAHPQDGVRELNIDKFIDVVRESIGRVDTNPRSNSDWVEVTPAVCQYFSNHMPGVISAMRDLSDCSSALKSDQVELAASESARLAINTWKGVFSSFDDDCDSSVTLAEISEVLQLYNLDIKETSTEVIKKLQAFFQQDNLTNSYFLSTVTSLLFDSPDNQVWQNVTSEAELQGKSLFCEALRETHNDVRARLRGSEECITLYKETLTSVLHDDSTLAPAYIFALADKNKDGVVTSKLLESLVFSSCSKQIPNSNASYPLETFQKILPDRVVNVKKNHNDDSIELSVLSSNDLQVWDAFCMTAVEALEGFPTSMAESRDSKDTHVKPEMAASSLSDADIMADLERRLLASEKDGDFNILEAFDTFLDSFPTSTNSASLPETNQATFDAPTAEDSERSERTIVTPETTQLSQQEFGKTVDDVINYLNNQNKTAAAAQKNEELESIMEQVNTTISEGGDVQEFSKEEQELMELLEKYSVDTDAVKGSPNDVTIDNDNVLSPDLSHEEAQLERLMKQAMKDKDTLQ